MKAQAFQDKGSIVAWVYSSMSENKDYTKEFHEGPVAGKLGSFGKKGNGKFHQADGSAVDDLEYSTRIKRSRKFRLYEED